MTPRPVVLALVLSVGIGLSPSAVPAAAECLVPRPLPATPVQPVLSVDVSHSSHRFRIYLWRQLCEEGSDAGERVLYARITPITSNPVVCSFVTLIQNSRQVDAALRTGPNGATLCGTLFAATTFLVAPLKEDPRFDSTQAFTFVFRGDGDEFALLEVPAAGPPPPSPPTVTVVATGCTACKIGDLAEIHLHFVNPGPARVVELKLGSRFPDGVTSALFLGRYVEHTVPTGESDLLVPGITVPGGLPFGIYVIETAILDPDFGTTLSQHAVTASLVP